MMRPVPLAAALALAATAALAAPVVTDAQGCQRAVADAREAAAAASVGERARQAGMEIISLSQTRCAEGNFAAADQLLAIARGIFAEE